MKIDFTQIEWGVLELGQTGEVVGDRDMLTAERPTIQNTGNVPMYLEVRLDPMYPDGSTIGLDTFAVQWRGSLQTGMKGGVPFCFAQAALLAPNESDRLDLSVLVPNAIAPGDYRGQLQIIAREKC